MKASASQGAPWMQKMYVFSRGNWTCSWKRNPVRITQHKDSTSSSEDTQLHTTPGYGEVSYMLLQADPVSRCQRQNILLGVLVWPSMVALVFLCICRYKPLQGRCTSIRALTQPGYAHTHIHQITLRGAVTTTTAVTFITGMQVLHTVASHDHWHKPHLHPSAVPQSCAQPGSTHSAWGSCRPWAWQGRRKAGKKERLKFADTHKYEWE